jgi:hypothetical protein
VTALQRLIEGCPAAVGGGWVREGVVSGS